MDHTRGEPRSAADGNDPSITLSVDGVGDRGVASSVVALSGQQVALELCDVRLSHGQNTYEFGLGGSIWMDNRTTVEAADGACDLTYHRADASGDTGPGDLLTFVFREPMAAGMWEMRLIYIPTANSMCDVEMVTD